jgi:Flp pilus assembly protein TadG
VFVETALIFSIFVVMLVAVFDFAQFLFVQQALVERARAAARWGAIQNPTDSTSITNMVLYNHAATPPDGTPAYFNLTSSNVAVTNPGAGTDSYRLNIQISGYKYTIISPYITGRYTGPPILVSVPLGLYN